MKYVAFIPMRGGSKSIPQKNIKELAGKPLCFWSIEAVLASGSFDQVVVSTEDEKILEVVKGEFKEKVIIDRRPYDLALDDTSTEDVVLEFLQRVNVDVLCLVQVTSPMVKPKDFKQAKDFFHKGGFDSLLSVCQFKRFLWSSDGNAINHDPANRLRRQDFKGQFLENGAFYFTKSWVYRQEKNRIGGKVGMYEMNQGAEYEIDEPEDWDVIEALFAKKQKNNNED